MTNRVQRWIGRIEQAAELDGPAQALVSASDKVIPSGPVEDTLSGTQLGHPLHPALVALPIGAWATATLLDATGGGADAARRAIAFGVLTAAPTALSGASDWRSTDGAERRVGLVHAGANWLAIGLQLGSLAARRRQRRGLGSALSVIANVAVGAGGWLGGHLAYALGVGVDTTAFMQLPGEWTDVAAEPDVPDTAVLGVDVAGVPVLLARTDGRIVALADRCTHRGGPLHEGDVADGCVSCPWHGSAFALTDGAVRSGPATRPQPVLEVDVIDGRVRIRRREQRTLRVNPVGT